LPAQLSLDSGEVALSDLEIPRDAVAGDAHVEDLLAARIEDADLEGREGDAHARAVAAQLHGRGTSSSSRAGEAAITHATASPRRQAVEDEQLIARETVARRGQTSRAARKTRGAAELVPRTTY
jgi:hypothetical protein